MSAPPQQADLDASLRRPRRLRHSPRLRLRREVLVKLSRPYRANDGIDGRDELILARYHNHRLALLERDRLRAVAAVSATDPSTSSRHHRRTRFWTCTALVVVHPLGDGANVPGVLRERLVLGIPWRTIEWPFTVDLPRARGHYDETW